ncbi:MAG: hypothetical protein GX072_10510 [Lysinibacillus sp.]|nr:hypothetical protein [Lysinibacillus sp.]
MGNYNKIIDLGMFIAILNIFDGFATNYGLTNHYIEEANPIMKHMSEVSPILFLGVKITLSILIYFISLLVYYKSSTSFQKFFSISMTVVSIIYVGITLMHLYWLSQVLTSLPHFL